MPVVHVPIVADDESRVIFASMQRLVQVINTQNVIFKFELIFSYR